MLPLLSVIIPTYNRLDFLKLAIDSALNQSHPNVEVIVVDDGSADGTAEWLAEFCKQHKPCRFHYVIQENKGPSSARNHGLKISHGEYIQFLDSDDCLEYGSSHEFIRMMEKYQASLVIGSRAYMSPEGRVWSVNYMPPCGVISNPVSDFFNLKLKPQGALWCYRRSIFEKNLWDETLLAREDNDLLLRVLLDEVVVCGAPKAIYHQRYHRKGRQMDRQFEPQVLKSIIAASNRHLLLMKSLRVSLHIRRAFARSLVRTALRLWAIDRASALRMARIARQAFLFSELVVTNGYPASGYVKSGAYILWMVGGIRLCGPIWSVVVRRKRSG